MELHALESGAGWLGEAPRGLAVSDGPRRGVVAPRVVGRLYETPIVGCLGETPSLSRLTRTPSLSRLTQTAYKAAYKAAIVGRFCETPSLNRFTETAYTGEASHRDALQRKSVSQRRATIRYSPPDAYRRQLGPEFLHIPAVENLPTGGVEMPAIGGEAMRAMGRFV